MSSISSMVSSMAYANSSVNQASEAQQSSQAEKSNNANAKSRISGKTIGKPELSEKAAKYYESLKKKYSNMEFILVSEDQKEMAKAQAGKYASADKMVVLIDEDKIERMAEDDKYRKQYEGIIANAASGLSQLGEKMASTGADVKGYGMQVNDDGTASFFAVLEKSTAAQKQRIEKKAEQKKEEKKAEAKKAKKKEEQERLEKIREKNSKVDTEDDSTVTITASSMDELIQKIQAQVQLDKTDSVQTDTEKAVGQNFDFSI